MYTPYWINIDIPTHAVIIVAAHCRFVKEKTATPHHGVGELRRDGGWLDFISIQEAQDMARDFARDGFEVKRCSYCFHH